MLRTSQSPESLHAILLGELFSKYNE